MEYDNLMMSIVTVHHSVEDTIERGYPFNKIITLLYIEEGVPLIYQLMTLFTLIFSGTG